MACVKEGFEWGGGWVGGREVKQCRLKIISATLPARLIAKRIFSKTKIGKHKLRKLLSTTLEIFHLVIRKFR